MGLKQFEKKFLRLNVSKKVRIFNTYCKIKSYPHQILPLDKETIEMYDWNSSFCTEHGHFKISDQYWHYLDNGSIDTLSKIAVNKIVKLFVNDIQHCPKSYANLIR